MIHEYAFYFSVI